MSLNPEHRPGTASFVSRCDPRWRIAAFGVAVLLVALLRTLGPHLVAGIVALVTVVVGRVPWVYVRPRLVLFGLGLLPFVLFVPWSVPRGTILWEWRFLRLTDVGLEVTATLVLKGLTITLLMLALLASGPFHTLLTAAGKIGLPRIFVQVTLLTYRYVFVLLDELNRLRVALRVRAFRNRLNAHSLRTIGQVTGTLVVRGSDRAERVAHAMRCRGYTGYCRTMQTFQTTWRDPVWWLWLVGSLALLVGWERWP